MTKVLNFIFLLFILFTCQKQEDVNYKLKLLISEPLTNRIIDDGKSPTHDKNCIGYHTKHFEPSLLDSNYFDRKRIRSLNNLTGLNWSFLTTQDSVINFNHLFKDNTNKIVYLAEIFESPENQNYILSIGSDDGFIVWHNGKLISMRHIGRGLLPNSDFVKLNMRRGKNVLLYKVDQGDGGWAFYRKIISNEKLNKIISHNVTELYSDLPESCILPTTSKYIRLKSDPRYKYDLLHNIKFTWKSIADNTYQNISYIFNAYQIPDSLKLPDYFPGSAILEIIVFNQFNKKVYQEEIPIYYKKDAFALSKKLIMLDEYQNDPILYAQKEAVSKFFNTNSGKVNTNYSSRTITHALTELFHWTRHKKTKVLVGPRILGYSSKKDSTIQTYRAFIPAFLNPNTKYPVVFILRGVTTKNTDFWESYEGKSHTLMAKRAALSTKHNAIIVMPHGRGMQNYLNEAEEEIPRILEQLKRMINIDYSNISMFTGSSGPQLALQLLQTQQLPIKYLGFMSPILTPNITEINRILINIKNSYPNLKIFIRHGLEDTDAPISNTREWVDIIHKMHFDLDYKEIAHSTHWNYFFDPEEEFLSTIQSKRTR